MVEIPAYLTLKQKAKEQCDIAFHLCNVTFPLTKDPKILLGLAQNIAATQESALESILNYERALKLVPAYGSQFASKFSLFQQRSARRHNFPAEITDSILKLREIIDLHKRSPQEFPRGQRFILADQHFAQLQPLSLSDLKEHLRLTKVLLDHADRIIRA